VGLYKLCEHKGRARDRCEHAWWARFRYVRVSLEKWSNREIATKTEAEAIFDDLKKAVRASTFDKCRAEPECKTTALTFRQFADIYKERHVFAMKLAIGKTIDYRLKPIIEYFGERPLGEIRTADVEDFIADLRKPHIAARRKTPRILAPASINRTIELLRHMMNWAVGREYIDRTPFRRGTETLIRKLREDNQRRRRVSEDEEGQLLAMAPPFLRSMIITALDTGMRQGEMLALRFQDIDFARGRSRFAARPRRAGRRDSCRSRRLDCGRCSNGSSSMPTVRRCLTTSSSSATRLASLWAVSEPRG
jgi:integrase